MTHWLTKRGTEIFRIHSGRSNAYCISASGRHVLVDTGKKRPIGSLEMSLRRLHAEHIDALVLTHSHYDHADNAAALKTRYAMPIVIHRRDAAFLEHGDSPVPPGSLAVTRLITSVFVPIVQPWFRYEPIRPDLLVDDAFDLRCYGINAVLLHTPGHSPGSMSVIVDHEIAIVGDAMMGVYPGSIFTPFAEDVPEMIRSWKKLLDTGCALFLPGHGRANSAALVEKEYERLRKRYRL